MTNDPDPTTEETLSRWRILPHDKNGYILLGISKIFFLAAVMAFWMMKEDPSTNTEQICFISVWVIILAAVTSSMIPQLRKFDRFTNFYSDFVILAQGLLCAIISIKLCDQDFECATTISKVNVNRCLTCYNLNGASFGSLNRGLQLRVGKQGISLIMFLLCEVSTSRIFYSTIPFQILMIALPSLSEGEAAASIVSVCGSITLCLVKIIEISHKKLSQGAKAKPQQDITVLAVSVTGKKSNLKGITKVPHSKAIGDPEQRQVFFADGLRQDSEFSDNQSSQQNKVVPKHSNNFSWEHPPGSGPVLVRKTFVKETQKEVYSYQSPTRVSFAPLKGKSRKTSSSGSVGEKNQIQGEEVQEVDRTHRQTTKA